MDETSNIFEEPTAIMGTTTTSTTLRTRNTKVAVFCYCVLFLLATFTISITLYEHPLFPVRPESLEWNNAWLIATVVDYYGACLCFCGIVLYSEPSWTKGLAWAAGCCILGSPVCCVWTLLRLRKEGSLRLIDTTTTTTITSATNNETHEH